MRSWLVATLLPWFFVAATDVRAQAHAQADVSRIEWLVPQATNHLVSHAHASVGMDIKDSCTAAMLHRPKVCAWCDQFNRCRQQVPAANGSFSARDEAVANVRMPSGDAATTRTRAQHDVVFAARSLRLANNVATTFERQGKSVPSNRGIASTSGEIYFRVSQGEPLAYELSGELLRAGMNGHFQLIGVPNTGANSDGFGFNTNHLPANTTSLKKAGRLTAGVYRLFWFLTADQISHGGSISGSLVANLDFGAAPVASNVAGSCPVIVPRRKPPPAQQSAAASRATAPNRFDPDAKAVDLDLGSTPGTPLLTRQDLKDEGLPVRSCVIAGHGNPSAIYYTPQPGEDGAPVPTTVLAQAIRKFCNDNEPVVLLSCETGRGNSGRPNFAQQLADTLRAQGRRSATVWAPNTKIAAAGALPSDPSIVNFPDARMRNGRPSIALGRFRAFHGR